MHTTTTPEATNPAAAADTTGGVAAPVRRPRRAARCAALVLAAASALGAFAGPALAETPPAPKPTMDIADPGPGVNHHKIWNIVTTSGDTFADVTFRSDAPTIVVQTSLTKPVTVDGKLSMGAVQPQALGGKKVPGKPGDLAIGTVYEYAFTRDGMTPGNMYWNLYSIPGSNGQSANQTTSVIHTKSRYVRMTPLSVHVSDDADHGLRGKGEISFGFRAAPDANPLTPSLWSTFTGEYKLDSGSDLDLAKLNLGFTTKTKGNTAFFQAQGRENDVDAHDWDCAIQGGIERIGEQYSDHCYDNAVAEALVQLPTGRYTGAHKQVVEAKVSRSPALKFQVKVLVETWYA